jgi:hypothetical protein
MLKPMILPAFLLLMPATILLTSHSSIAESTGDECRTRPGTSASPGLHWYYRIDRTNNRHCWYLHAQGLQTHSLTNVTSREAASRDENVGVQARREPPRIETVQPAPADRSAAPRMRSETPAPEASESEYPGLEFAARWIDLPRSIDLDRRESMAGSNSYATERAAANAAEQLPSSLSIISGEDGATRSNSTTEPKLGSISLAGAAVLILLLLSEGVVRLVRTAAATAWRRPIRARLHGIGGSSLAGAASGQPWRPAPPRDAGKPGTGLSELRRALRRADAGLRPSQSFAPSQSIIRKHDRAKLAFQRLKAQSCSPRWAPL